MPHSTSADRLRWAGLIVGLWTLYAINETVHSYFQFRIWQRPMAFAAVAYAEFTFAYLCAALTPAVVWLGRNVRVARPHRARNLAIHILSAMLFMIVVRLSWDLLGASPRPFQQGGATLWKAIVAVSGTYESTFSAYLMILLAGYVHEYQRRYREEAVRAEKLRSEIVQAQLQSLKMQLQPHFLFNTLHTISALVQQAPSAAERTITQLSDLLRNTLEHGRHTFVTLAEEMSTVELYLDIERTRYEERLAVNTLVDPEVVHALVPSFILQPLVENAIRHGIAHSARAGRVFVEARRCAANLILIVRNTGPQVREPVREGVGIAATKSRLEFLYGNRAEFRLCNLTSSEVEASITVPFTIEDTSAGSEYEHSYADRGRRKAGAGTPPAVAEP